MTTPNPAMRERYLADSVTTASPAKLLVMLYDRLVLDLDRGEQALLAGDRAEAGHAAPARPGHRPGAAHLAGPRRLGRARPGLANLYAFLLTELMEANVAGDAARVAACRGLVEPLRDAWREAAPRAAAGGRPG